MSKSYYRDVQLLLNIIRNQRKIIEAINYFGCNQSNLDKNTMAFDLCAFYMAQIGETAKLLTDNTKESFRKMDVKGLVEFRNKIDHVYDRVNRTVLKKQIFNVISPQVTSEIEQRIQYCMKHRK